MWKTLSIALGLVGAALVLNLSLIEHGHSFSGAPTLLPVVVHRTDTPLFTIQVARAESACVQVGGCTSHVDAATYVEGLYARDESRPRLALWGGLVLPAALAVSSMTYVVMALRRRRT